MGYGDPRRPGDNDAGARPTGGPTATAATVNTPERTEAGRPRAERAEGDPRVDHQGRAHARPAGAGLVPILLALLVGVALGVGGALALDRNGAPGPADPFTSQIDRGSYQAVILANDRVYFGQIRAANADFYRLENAYFLRESRADEASEPVRALLPVNREIHGPKNEMLIARSEVVLVEDLAPDSPILREIKRQQESGTPNE